MASTDKDSQPPDHHDQVTEQGPDSPALRPSTEKKSLTTLAVDRLPDEIIEQILQLADPDSFASLILVNSKWRRVSQQAHLYAHQLQKCSSYPASHNAPPPQDLKDDDNENHDDEKEYERKLHELRKTFAREVKRNLFEAYLRPSETTIKLISNSISSSSCPGGESMHFSPSPRGHRLLAYNSSRIYVIDVCSESIQVTREFKILRRPVSTCIKDDGTLLAVLSSEMQVDLYDLNESPPRRLQSLILDHAPRTIAMSPCGSVLAAAYDGGIEVSSLNPAALPTDRRAVKCDAVDTLAFSFDGTQLLGTTIQSSSPNTVVLTAPYYDPANIIDNNMIALWTTSILFPNTSRDCSHAVLLQDTSREEASWTFTYDRSFETFRAVRIDDLRNGTTYFTGPIPSPRDQVKLLPSTSPSATYHGDLVAAGFKGKDVWVYGIPEDLDAVPECTSSSSDSADHGSPTLGRRANGEPFSSRTPSSKVREGCARPQWQLLCDKLRNTFVWGTKVAEMEGVSCVKWVCGFGGSSSQERLVIAARGVTPASPIAEHDDVDFIDGGRITLLDFDYAIEDGVKREITLEVGTNEPEVLEEERRDMDTEVAIVRRRTVAQKRGNRGALLRSATTAGTRATTPPVSDIPPLPNDHRTNVHNDDDDPLVPRRIGVPPPRASSRSSASAGVADESESASLIEAQEAVDAPYSHDNPRSTTTLRRAATAAAVSRRRNPSRPVAGDITYTRADGRREHPHESDADNWVPPPPPYQKEDPGDVPAFLRQAVAESGRSGPATSLPVVRYRTAAPTTGPSAWPLSSVVPSDGLSSHRRTASDGTSSVSRLQSEELARPTSSASIQISNHTGSKTRRDDDHLYEVSPPDSPRLPAQPPSGNTQPTESRMQPPTLALRIPSPTFGTSAHHLNAHAQGSHGSGEPISGRRIASATTWPTAPGPGGRHMHSASMPGYPHTAPPIGANANEIIATTFPPLPDASNPRASLGSRGSACHSSVQRMRLGSRGGNNTPHGDLAPSPHHVPLPPTPVQPASSPPPEDQPLIISTPSGVSGAFDPPSAHDQGQQPRSETPILAPIPRHPHTDPDGRQTVERLDPSYVSPSARPQQSLMPSWLSAPSTTSNGQRSNSSLNRKPSRAERSAARNMQDAKRRGWRGTRKGRRKKVDHEVASSAAWTDVSVVPRSQADDRRQKKCVVM